MISLITLGKITTLRENYNIRENYNTQFFVVGMMVSITTADSNNVFLVIRIVIMLVTRW